MDYTTSEKILFSAEITGSKWEFDTLIDELEDVLKLYAYDQNVAVEDMSEIGYMLPDLLESLKETIVHA